MTALAGNIGDMQSPCHQLQPRAVLKSMVAGRRGPDLPLPMLHCCQCDCCSAPCLPCFLRCILVWSGGFQLCTVNSYSCHCHAGNVFWHLSHPKETPWRQLHEPIVLIHPSTNLLRCTLSYRRMLGGKLDRKARIGMAAEPVTLLCVTMSAKHPHTSQPRGVILTPFLRTPAHTA